MICAKCGRIVEPQGAAFCPFCGTPAEVRSAVPGPEAEKWLREAANTVSYPEKEKILLRAREACPDCFEIEWELLFIGQKKKPARGRIDFSMIRSYLLEIWLTPEEFTRAETNQMRSELFENEQLARCRRLSEDPEGMTEKYLYRLCREFIDLFMEGDSRIVRSLFGFRLDRNTDRVLSQHGAGMLIRIRQDAALEPVQKDQLYQAFYRALSEKLEGRTRYLEEALAAP